MKTLLTLARIATTLTLALCLPASAQSLGTPRSQAWLGQPLEFSVPARLAGDGRDDCVQAEVHYGARRIPGKHVQASVQRAGNETRLHVRVAVAVDEPAVSVAVRAGCGSTVMRRYAVLAEPGPHGLTAAAAPVGAPVAAPAVAAAMRPDPEVRIARAELATRTAGAGVLPAGTRVQRAAPPAPRPRMEAGGADPPALLRVSGVLANPLGDPAQRVVAARLWQAFKAEPQELMRTAAMLQALEAELAMLRQTAGRTHADVLRVQRRGDASPPPAAPSALLPWALLAALALGAAALLWRQGALRGAPAGHWYGTPASAGGAGPATDPALPAVARLSQDAAAREASPASSDALPSQPAFEPLQSGAGARAGRGPEVAAAQAQLAAKVASARLRADAKVQIFRVDALASCLQEAEFLRSLGLGEEARDVLRAHLADANSPSPLAYYELMRLCAQGEDAPTREIPLLRRRFHEQFKTVAPSMDELDAPGGIECHPKVLARIAAVWPTPKALDIIEKRLFATPESADHPITLEAWRDLLWLYEFAQQLQLGPAAAHRGGRPESAVMAPWADLDTGGFDLSGGDFGGARNFAVDLDLGVPQAASEWSEGALALEPIPPPVLAR